MKGVNVYNYWDRDFKSIRDPTLIQAKDHDYLQHKNILFFIDYNKFVSVDYRRSFEKSTVYTLPQDVCTIYNNYYIIEIVDKKYKIVSKVRNLLP